MIQVSTDESGVAAVTLARPERRNAMSADLVDQLIAFLASNTARVIVLTGAGSGFCAGSDLAGLAAMNEAGREAFEEASGRVARMLVEAPTPVIAAVSGFAIGGGLTLATSCDIVVTHPAAKWSLPEVPIGLFPAWGLASVAARVGVPAARRLSLGLETIDGIEAQRIGLADRLSDDPLADALDLARRLAGFPAAQIAAVKAHFADPSAYADDDARANRAFLATTRTPEAEASFVRFGGK